MIDAGSITALISSAKTAFDMTKGLSDLRDQAAFQSRQIELQQQILDVQGRALSVQSTANEQAEHIRSLKRQLDEANDWTATASRYKLAEVGRQRFVYALREESKKPDEPTHYCCPTCFERKIRSVLQFDCRNFNSEDEYNCTPCGNTLRLGDRQQKPLKYR